MVWDGNHSANDASPNPQQDLGIPAALEEA